MSDQYEAFRAFARAEIAHAALQSEIRLKEILIREVPPLVKVEPGLKGDKGDKGADSVEPGPKGDAGDKGDRGTDGMVTREEMLEEIEKRVAEINVRTFADIYKGVYKPDELYTRGVLTTWGGSLWLSLVDTKKKPGENGDWRLIVKK